MLFKNWKLLFEHMYETPLIVEKKVEMRVHNDLKFQQVTLCMTCLLQYASFLCLFKLALLLSI